MMKARTKQNPLTLDELIQHGKDKRPVFCFSLKDGEKKWAFAYIRDEEQVCTDADFQDWEFYEYGIPNIGWVAYRKEF